MFLSDDTLGHVFQFVGKGHFRYVAGTSVQFLCVYKEAFKKKKKPKKDQDRIAGTNKHGATQYCCPKKPEGISVKATSMASIVESVSRCRLFLIERFHTPYKKLRGTRVTMMHKQQGEYDTQRKSRNVPVFKQSTERCLQLLSLWNHDDEEKKGFKDVEASLCAR